MSVYFCLPNPVALGIFIICSGLCACNNNNIYCPISNVYKDTSSVDFIIIDIHNNHDRYTL